MNPQSRVGVLGILVVVVGLVLLGVYAVQSRADSGAPAPTATGEKGPAALTKFYTQKLTWKGCGSDARCTWVRVPIDYAHPDGATLRLRVKVLAAGDKKPLGALFINPGGPGGSGVEFLAPFAKEASSQLLQKYDIVGFDPRGTGNSTPLKCLSDKAFSAYTNLDPDPDTPAEIAAGLRGTHDLGEACLKNSGELARHVSTVEAAKDIDVMRALFGDKKLDYYGASYGTELGAVYAQLFPTKVGRMVLDGAVDPSLDNVQSAMGQNKGFTRALNAYIAHCVRQKDCPLGHDKATATTKLADFLQKLDQKPLKTASTRVVTEAMGIYGIAVTLYNRSYWTFLTQELQTAFKGDGTLMLNYADAYFKRNPNGTYADNSGQSIYAINCADSSEKGTVAEVEKVQPEFEKVSPVFGAFMSWGVLGCAGWPIKVTNPLPKISAKGAPPILVVGTTRDPATPYEWAQALAKQLTSGVLLTRVGDGHTGYGSGSTCIDDGIDNFLLTGKVPKKGTICHED